MRTACLCLFNNGLGLLNDVSLIQDLLLDSYDTTVHYLYGQAGTGVVKMPTGSSTPEYLNSYDVGIHFQDFTLEGLNISKKNILIVNEEWTNNDKLRHIHEFDKIIVKSTFAEQLFKPLHTNVVNCGFISKDKYKSNYIKQNTFLHCVGKSIQKGTEAVLSCFYNKDNNLTVVSSNPKHQHLPKSSNVEYIEEYQTDESILKLLNSNLIHLCPSLYEGWGHYVYEGLSTGALVYATRIPMFLEWLDPDLVVFLDCEFEGYGNTYNNRKFCDDVEFLTDIKGYEFPYKFGWRVKPESLNEHIEKHTLYLERHNQQAVRNYFKHLTEQNSKMLLRELTDI